MPESFQEKFCRHFAVPADRYPEAMLRRTLYRRARWLRWFLPYDFISADRDFIHGVGRLTRRGDFSSEVKEFQRDARNRNFWRSLARCRVSSTRMRAVFVDVWPEATAPGVSAGPTTPAPAGARVR